MKQLVIFVMACIYVVSCAPPIDDEIKPHFQGEQQVNPEQSGGQIQETPEPDHSDGEDNGFEFDTEWLMMLTPIDAPSNVAIFFDTNLPESSENSDTGFALDEETSCIVINSMEELKEIAFDVTELPEIDFSCYTLIIGRLVADSSNLVYKYQHIGVGEERTVLMVGYTANIVEESDTMTYYNFWGVYEKLTEEKVELNVVIG